MRNFSFHTAVCMALCLAALPAHAQTSPGGDMQAPKLQPQGEAPAPLPPAVPGADDQNMQTSQSVAKQQTGDPTTDLFTAINAGDYNSAQDAISRGADLNAQNALGETPIDLSVALNRNSITFMLLAARNDSGDDEGQVSGTPLPVAAAAPEPARHTRAKPIEHASVPLRDDPGTPDASAGFLGFNR